MTIRQLVGVALALAPASPVSAQTSPDLKALGAVFRTAPFPVRIGRCNTVSVRITNVGASLRTPFEVKATTMNSPESGTTSSRVRVIDSLPRGDTIAVTLSGLSAWGGTTLLQGSADSKNQAVESNEQNNLANGSGTADSYCSSIQVNDTTGSEGGKLVFTVRRGGSTTESLSVAYEALDGTATGGSCSRDADYQATKGTLTFSARVASMQVSVPLCPNRVLGRTGKTMKLVLSSPSFGATLTDKEGIGTMYDLSP